MSLLFVIADWNYNMLSVSQLSFERNTMVRLISPICILMFSIAISGCQRSHPGNYSQQEVEAQVKKSLKLSEIQIAPDPAGGYSGSGKTADGEGFKLKISQDAVQKSLKWKAEGNRGTIEDGSFSYE